MPPPMRASTGNGELQGTDRGHWRPCHTGIWATCGMEDAVDIDDEEQAVFCPSLCS